MKKTLSRASRFALAAAFFAAVAGVVVPRGFPAPHVSATTVDALREERDRLASNTDAHRDTLRQKVAARLGPPWDQARLAEFRKRLGPDWQCSDVTESRGLIVASSPERCRWDAVLAAVAGIEREPGLVIERLDFAAAGSGSARRFTRVVITVRLLRPRPRTRANPERAAALSARSRLAGPRTADPAGKIARFRLRSARRPRTPGRSPLRRLRATLPASASCGSIRFPTETKP